jgi:hypothetical protein
MDERPRSQSHGHGYQNTEPNHEEESEQDAQATGPEHRFALYGLGTVVAGL